MSSSSSSSEPANGNGHEAAATNEGSKRKAHRRLKMGSHARFNRSAKVDSVNAGRVDPVLRRIVKRLEEKYRAKYKKLALRVSGTMSTQVGELMKEFDEHLVARFFEILHRRNKRRLRKEYIVAAFLSDNCPERAEMVEEFNKAFDVYDQHMKEKKAAAPASSAKPKAGKKGKKSAKASAPQLPPEPSTSPARATRKRGSKA